MAPLVMRCAAALLLLAGLLVGSPGYAAEALIVAPRPPDLQRRLDAALAAKGTDYRPRTGHLLPDGRPRFTNRLILEDSPYLLQHAHNPVDWYPWGPDAFERARREGKLVFLPIGYSPCHWCHVMEVESFENPMIAGLLNAHFIAIKVDREVHPDIDQIYMTAVELLTGGGGWPMSSLLTPDGETITAGTYFPPAEFAQLLERASALWVEQPDELRAQARRVAGAVARALATRAQAAALDDGVIDRAVTDLLARHDDLQGGFGQAPKFPQEPQLALLLDRALRNGDDQALRTAVFTLRAMARGGIHDQVGGGVHRYATDNDWLVPHFEKMLYNQAQLARLYLAAGRLTGDPELTRVARRTLDFVLRDLTSPEGGFYSATDADSAGGEGRFFLWTQAEIRAALAPEDADLAMRYYGVSEAGNFEGGNILHVPVAPEVFAASAGFSPAQWQERLGRIDQVLYQARKARPHPHRDEKILTAWNGQTIAALAEAGAALDEPRYLAAAGRAADLLWAKVRTAPGELKRVYLGCESTPAGCRDHSPPSPLLGRGRVADERPFAIGGPGEERVGSRAAQPALLEDYALLGEGLIALYDASADPRWLARARELAAALWERFADPEGGGLFMGGARADTPLMARPKDLSDGAMPSATSAALHLLAALDQRTDDLGYGQHAQELIASASGLVQRAPSAFPSLLVGLARLRHGDAGADQYAARGAVRLRGSVARQGDGGTLIVALDMAPGWHINAQKPLQEELIGTRLELPGEAPAWRIGTILYPRPETLRLGFQREPLAVYQGQVRIEAALTPVPEGADRAGAWLPVTLRLQACSNDRCLPPETRALQIPVEDHP